MKAYFYTFFTLLLSAGSLHAMQQGNNINHQIENHNQGNQDYEEMENPLNEEVPWQQDQVFAIQDQDEQEDRWLLSLILPPRRLNQRHF